MAILNKLSDASWRENSFNDRMLLKSDSDKVIDVLSRRENTINNVEIEPRLRGVAIKNLGSKINRFSASGVPTFQ